MNLNSQTLFSTPILKTAVNTKLADYMEDLIVPKIKNLDYIKDEQVHTDYHRDNNKKIVNSDELKPFIEVTNLAADFYVKQLGIKFKNKVEWWVQDYKKNQYYPYHAHPGASISGIYYVRANDKAGDLEFSTPNPHVYFEHHTDKKTRFKNLHHRITPEKGLLVLFPSWLYHKVISSNSKNIIRTCLAFNYE